MRQNYHVSYPAASLISIVNFVGIFTVRVIPGELLGNRGGNEEDS